MPSIFACVAWVADIDLSVSLIDLSASTTAASPPTPATRLEITGTHSKAVCCTTASTRDVGESVRLESLQQLDIRALWVLPQVRHDSLVRAGHELPAQIGRRFVARCPAGGLLAQRPAEYRNPVVSFGGRL